ncbi:MAG: energy transducer TonB family protein [Sphingobium sp.]
MKHIVKALTAASALMLAPTAALAGTRHLDHASATPLTLAKWAKHITTLVDQRLDYPDFGAGQVREGVVTVKFLCSESGAPSDVKLLKSSGSKQLDRAALKAVREVVSLHPLPDGMLSTQKYQAMLLFAKDQVSHKRQMAALRQQALEGNKWFGNRPQVKLGVGLLDEGKASQAQVGMP